MEADHDQQMRRIGREGPARPAALEPSVRVAARRPQRSGSENLAESLPYATHGDEDPHGAARAEVEELLGRELVAPTEIVAEQGLRHPTLLPFGVGGLRAGAFAVSAGPAVGAPQALTN